jgi:hypothetical protein
MSRTGERRDALLRLFAEPGLSFDSFIESFLTSALFPLDRIPDRLYSCPSANRATGRLSLARKKCVCQYIDRFDPGEYVHDYGDLLQSSKSRSLPGT